MELPLYYQPFGIFCKVEKIALLSQLLEPFSHLHNSNISLFLKVGASLSQYRGLFGHLLKMMFQCQAPLDHSHELNAPPPILFIFIVYKEKALK